VAATRRRTSQPWQHPPLAALVLALPASAGWGVRPIGERQKVGGQAQGVADVEELFLSVQLELVQCFRPRLPPKAVELLNS
jgi:hypothetical protein